MSNIRSRSRRTTLWTGKEDATPLQSFIDKCNRDSFERRHPGITETGEAELVNSFEVDSCRWCGSEKIKAFGYTAAGIRRHRCNQCGKTFTPLSNTIFDSRKIPLTEWLDFLLSVFGYESFKLMSKANGNAHNTTRYWIQKVFIVLREYQAELILKDEIQLDETYYKVRSERTARNTEEFKGTRSASELQAMDGTSSFSRKDWKSLPAKAPWMHS